MKLLKLTPLSEYSTNGVTWSESLTGEVRFSGNDLLFTFFVKERLNKGIFNVAKAIFNDTLQYEFSYRVSLIGRYNSDERILEVFDPELFKEFDIGNHELLNTFDVLECKKDKLHSASISTDCNGKPFEIKTHTEFHKSISRYLKSWIKESTNP